MKSSVSAVVMLMMILGFVINAFAAEVVPQEKIIASVHTLYQLTPVTTVEGGNSTELEVRQSGETLGGRDCEASVGLYNDLFTAGIEMHESLFPFDQSKILITQFNDDGHRIDIVGFYKETGVRQEAIIETVGNPPTRVLKSIELLEEKNTFFSGPKMVSEVKCVL